MKMVIAIGGMIGSGKSTVAAALIARFHAAGIKAVHIEADKVRKTLWAVPHKETLPQEAYQPDAAINTQDVLAECFALAFEAITEGKVAILDMSFLHIWHREYLQEYCSDNDMPLLCIWCNAGSINILQQRVQQRKGSTSDADEQVIQNCLEDNGISAPVDIDKDSNASMLHWHEIDTSETVDSVIDDIMAIKV